MIISSPAPSPTSGRSKTVRKHCKKLSNEVKAGRLKFHTTVTQSNALPVKREQKKQYDFRGYNTGCSETNKENCSKKPLHLAGEPSNTPGKLNGDWLWSDSEAVLEGLWQGGLRWTVQCQNTTIKQRKMKTLRDVSWCNLHDECECGLSRPIDEHQVNQQSESWYGIMGNGVRREKSNIFRVMVNSSDNQGEPQRPDSLQ